MGLTSKAKNYLFKNNLYIYFIVDRVVPKRGKPFIFNLYSFYRTLVSYVDVNPVNQEAYFIFKDRYSKAISGTYMMDRFIAEEYVLMWVSLEQLLGKNYAWQQWTNQFLSIQDCVLRPFCFDRQESLVQYLKAHENLGSSFLALLGWDVKLEQTCGQLVALLKYQSLILRVKEHSLACRRYLPLLDTGLLSISEVELVRKPEAFRLLIRRHLDIINEALKELLLYLPDTKRLYRALCKALVGEMRRLNKRIYQDPHALFTKSPSYFKVSLRRLSLLLFWYKLTSYFQK